MSPNSLLRFAFLGVLLISASCGGPSGTNQPAPTPPGPLGPVPIPPPGPTPPAPGPTPPPTPPGPKAPGPKPKDTIADALLRGDSDAVRHLLLAKADPNEKSSTGEFALFIATNFDDSYTVRQLIEAGAKTDVRNTNGETLLTYAIKENKSSALSALLQKKAAIDAVSTAGDSPVFLAVEKAAYSLLDDLIKNKANVNVKKNGDTLLLFAIKKGNHAIVETLLKGGALPDTPSDSGELPLSAAIASANLMMIDHLLKAGANPNLKPANGDAPLFGAIDKGNWQLVIDLLAHKGDPNAKAPNGESLLHYAVKKGEQTSIQALVKAGADANDASSGESPLFAAVKSKFCGLIGSLAPSALLDGPDKNGDTPLIVAAREGRPCAVTELLQGGADPNLKNARGETALHVACNSPKNKTRDVLQDLQERGADLNAQDAAGNTPLHLLAQKVDHALYDFLTLYGAKEDIKNHEGKTPHDIMYAPVNVVKAIDAKLKSQPVMGLRDELITEAELKEFRGLDITRLGSAEQALYATLKTALEAQEKKLKLVIDDFGKGDPCRDLERWHELAIDQTLRLWVWDFGGAKANTSTKACSPLNMAQRQKTQHGANHAKTIGGPFENVVFQGAGPTGLLGALELYAAGSNVRVIEKRKKEYERKQILRLDPRWHATLQCFLAGDFDALVKSGKARVNKDETMEMPARELESVLKQRLEIQNREDPANSTFHYGEVTGINEVSGAVQCSGCTAKEYNASQLILAGGAANPVRNKLLGAPVVKTPEKPYAVAAFDKSGAAKNDNCLWARNFRDSVSPLNVSFTVSDVCRDRAFADSEHCRFKNFDNGVDARQFETDEVVYFGVELPEIAVRLFSECQAKPALEARTCIGHLATVFASEAVKHLTKLSCRSNLKLAAAQMFDLSQSALEVLAKVFRGSLAVTAAGDTLVTPHFFSGSGLSSARKAIEDLRELVGKVTFADYVKDVSARAAKTIEFTLNRGLPYFN